MRLAAEAWRRRTAAAEAIRAGRWNEALDHAREANRLHRTEAGEKLMLIATCFRR